MASGRDLPKEFEWALSSEERRRLARRFQQGLYRLLKAYEAWEPVAEGERQAVVMGLAKRIEDAGVQLDICASNCHALANTLRAHAGVDGVQPVTAHAGVRLSKSLGSPVVLTRTTIDQLAGRTVRLEYIEGANAIVQVNGEYWGTPLDRVLVVPDVPGAEDEDSTPPQPTQEPAFRFRLRRGELSNAVQFLTMTGRSGVMTVSSPAAVPAVGRLVLALGRVVHAQFGSYGDVEAVARLLRLEESLAVFEDGVESTERTMGLGTDQLLIEAAVKADELAP